MESNKSFKRLKAEARESLKGKWGLAIAATILNAIILWLPNLVAGMYKVFHMVRVGMEEEMGLTDDFTELTNSLQMLKMSLGSTMIIWVINIIIVGAFTYGIVRFFINLIRHKNPQIENLFEGFKVFGKTILVNLVLLVFKFLWSLLAVIAIVIFTFILAFQAVNSVQPNIGLIITYIILMLAITITLQIFLNRYALTYYIFNDNNDLDIMAIVNRSVELMQGKKIELFLLYLSFIGWYILGIISLGIGFIWINPYVKATVAAFYNNLVENNEEAHLENI